MTWDEFGNDPFSSVILDAQKSQLTESKSETHLTADIGYDTKSVGNGPYSHFIGTFIPITTKWMLNFFYCSISILFYFFSIGHAGTKRKAPPTGYICHRCNNPGINAISFVHPCYSSSDPCLFSFWFLACVTTYVLINEFCVERIKLIAIGINQPLGLSTRILLWTILE